MFDMPVTCGLVSITMDKRLPYKTINWKDCQASIDCFENKVTVALSNYMPRVIHILVKRFNRMRIEGFIIVIFNVSIVTVILKQFP